ncbi:MAG: protein kinase [Sandaracinaceae bacterium]
MRTDREYLRGLTQLHTTHGADARHAVWRQSMAALAAESTEHRPVPLEGLDPEAVLASVRTAIRAGLLDDLAFLPEAGAAAALYELASVLPISDARREIGRRVARHLHQGSASTFVALATQLASGSRRGLSGPAVRARVALALALPTGSGVRADPLALALVSRRELEAEWLGEPSTGSLPSRRLAARLLERAAREVARRAALGDGSLLPVFERPSVRDAWERLLADREPLVWRHVATARGLLAPHRRDLAGEIEQHLGLPLSPTEWRRAAASLAASIAGTPTDALARARALLDGPIAERDPGITGAMLLGLPRAAEVEPEAAEELCLALVERGHLGTFEALVALRQEEVGGRDFGQAAADRARALIRERALAEVEDDGAAATARAVEDDLRPLDERSETPSLRLQLRDALLAFATDGAHSAFDRAHRVLDEVEATVRALEGADPGRSRADRQAATVALRELDWALLETSTLRDLLRLGSRSEADHADAPLDAHGDRIVHWLLLREERPVAEGEHIAHPSMRVQQLRTLLHAVDTDAHGDRRQPELRRRHLDAFHVLLERVHLDAPSSLRRVVTAAAARAGDALLREEIGELSDLFLVVARRIGNPEALRTMAEASMVPEMVAAYDAYGGLVDRGVHGPRTSGARARGVLDALRRLVRALPASASPRVYALQRAVLAYSVATERVIASRSLTELTGPGDGQRSALQQLEQAARALSRLVRGARRRLEDGAPGAVGVVGPALRLVDIAVEQASRGERRALQEALAGAVEALHEDLPGPLADPAGNALVRIAALPVQPVAGSLPMESFLPGPSRTSERPLPPWVPPSRVLGGFYVLRALGSGAVGSVFIARRVEEKKVERAARFALKVPDYGGAAARTLSQEEFLRMFRQEAGALLAIPEHRNLARLVTFDAGARPKPILVMELVEGPTLERVVETGALTVDRALRILAGIADGLGAMHEVGVGHLDVKPSNVILRGQDAGQDAGGPPVLVDFGLAGRQVRPGCATASYGAPEIWGLVPDGHRPRPMPADVYALGCVAFEALTGRELVHGDSEVAVITSHLAHDGDFDGLRWLAQDPELRSLAETLSGCVRQDPRVRPALGDVRRRFLAHAEALARRAWPLEPRPTPAAG